MIKAIIVVASFFITGIIPLQLTPQDRIELARQIKDRIDGYCATNYDGGHRTHLGASQIGHECPRHLWYIFRWAKHEVFSGRMQRLFNRGHKEELRFEEWLNGIGFETSLGPDKGSPELQYRVSAALGHFGGSLDGLASHLDYGGETFLLEFKTSGTGAGFTAMLEKGVRRTKPMHFAQMCVYGTLRQLKYAIYMMINKNDDDLHVEVVELDWNYGNELIGKAHSIIVSPQPPPRISQSVAYHTCKYCNFKDICFNNAPMEKSCRTCKYVTPTDNATWTCSHYGVIPKDYVPLGCLHHDPIV